MPSSKLRNKPKPNTHSADSYRFVFDAIGTRWSISFKTALLANLVEKLRIEIHSRIELFDHHYSRFRPDSLVTAMSQTGDTYRLPIDAKPLFDLYQELYELTGGMMTPLIGRLLSATGYDVSYSFRPNPLPQTPSWDQVLDYNFPNLTLLQPALLDLGAAGKGYLVDIVAQLIERAGIVDFSINAGGDILQRQHSHRPEAIGLEHPDNFEQLVGIAHIKNQSLCGSAGNRRVWGNYHHIINPKDQASPKHLRAVWVIADSTLLADGLSTALFFTDATRLSARYNFEYAIIHDDYSLEHSPNAPIEFFTEERKV